jgi:hypothetical protein
MTQPQEIELWRAAMPQDAQRRSAAGVLLRSCAVSITRGRLEHQTEACDAHAAELCFGMKVVDRKRRSE